MAMETDRFCVVFMLVVCLNSMVFAAVKKFQYLQQPPAAYKVKGLNERCERSDECGTFGYLCVSNNTCQCAAEYLPNYEIKVCLGGIHQRCQYDEHCIDGAYCMNQSTCQCKEWLPIPSPDGLECTNGTSVQSSSLFVVGFLLLLLNT